MIQLVFNKLFFLIIILFFCSGCNHNVSKKNIKPTDAIKITKPANLVWVEMVVEGIECDACAYSVINGLRSIDGLKNPFFAGHYEQGVIKYQWNQETNVPLKQIMQIIKREGFSIRSLKGSFWIKCMHNENGEQNAMLDDVVIKIVDDVEKKTAINQEKWNNFPKNERIMIHATLFPGPPVLMVLRD